MRWFLSISVNDAVVLHSTTLAEFWPVHPAGGVAFAAPAQLREGEIHERLGDAAEAMRHYRRFVARWRDADPQYQPLVNDVRARIARLTADAPVE